MFSRVLYWDLCGYWSYCLLRSNSLMNKFDLSVYNARFYLSILQNLKNRASCKCLLFANSIIYHKKIYFLLLYEKSCKICWSDQNKSLLWSCQYQYLRCKNNNFRWKCISCVSCMHFNIVHIMQHYLFMGDIYIYYAYMYFCHLYKIVRIYT